MTNNIEVLRQLLREAVPYLRDAGEPFEDDGGNEPLELSRRIEDALESDAALAAMGGQGEVECHWHQQDESGDWFSTGCGHEFVLNDARQYADGDAPFPFCAYCAKPMRFYRWRDESPCTCDNGDGPECEGCTDNRRCSAISAPQQPEAQAGDIVKLCHDGQPCPKVYPEAQAVPVAWLYTLEYGGCVADTKVSRHQLRYPFGVCGSDYLARNDEGVSYVRETPLYTTPPAKVPEGMAAVLAEVERATRKFPTWPTDPLHAVAVLGEEFGELTKAVLQSVYEPHKSTPEDVATEAIQTAAMALRFLLSLDRYGYTRSEQHAQSLAAAPAPKEG